MDKDTSTHRPSLPKQTPLRRNLVNQRDEYWRPPLFKKNRAGLLSNLNASIRRFFDLQAGSVWDDLTTELRGVTGTVLDIGCGAQPYRALLPTDVTYKGIDTEDAKARFGYDVPDTTYFTGDKFPVETGGVDFILCSEVLEHIPNPDFFLNEIKRCLRPGGRLLLTVPFSARWHFIPYDYWRFTPSGLHRLLEKAGFINISVYARGNQLTVACYKQMAVILSLLLTKKGLLLTLTARLIGLALTPTFILLAVIANMTMKLDWGDDCLGYTITAESSVKKR